MGEEEFDIAAASESIGVDLGFATDSPAIESLETPEGTPLSEAGAAATATAPEAASSEAKASAETTSPPPVSPAPRTWRPEAAAEWDKLPPSVQAEVLKREEDMFRGLEGYKQDAAVGKSFQQILAPHMQTFQQYGLDPVAQVRNLLQAHHTLALGAPEQKAALLQKIAADYGVQLGEAPYVDPQVAALQKEIASLKSGVSAVTAQREQEVRNTLTQELNAFAADPANADFDLVANDIAFLIRTGAATTLKDAYEKAVWMNPTARANALTRQQAEQQAAAKKAAEEKAAAARKATAANVTTTPKTASAAAPLGTMDDTLEATLASIKARG